MRMKKVGLLSLALVLVLALTGAAFAKWSETLKIEGTVNTGELDVAWSVEQCSDNETAGKDCSNVTASITDYTMYVTLNNAYPCIEYKVDFNIENTGTIPFHIGAFNITESDLPACSTIEITDLNCTQVHPGDKALGSVKVHLCNDALEGHTYNFKAELEVVQWNEA
ncbi:unnamed protein product [marine sediment metagenome]|uniref:Uncharacterized protein n=1 Tax=marine sediment metagenome TaxID=412755 RepID=X1PFD1_9ZZZZ